MLVKGAPVVEHDKNGLNTKNAVQNIYTVYSTLTKSSTIMAFENIRIL